MKLSQTVNPFLKFHLLQRGRILIEQLEMLLIFKYLSTLNSILKMVQRFLLYFSFVRILIV